MIMRRSMQFGDKEDHVKSHQRMDIVMIDTQCRSSSAVNTGSNQLEDFGLMTLMRIKHNERMRRVGYAACFFCF